MTRDEKRKIRVAKAEQMATFYSRGWTLRDIGGEYGESAQRVGQLLKEIGVTKKDGGGSVKAMRAKVVRDRATKKKTNAWARKRIEKSFGCSKELWEELGGHKWIVLPSGVKTRKGQPIQNYLNAKTQASFNKQKFTLTLEQWWDTWTQSGKWDQRGTKKGQYVMARIDKGKPYETGNVRIIKAEHSK